MAAIRGRPLGGVHGDRVPVMDVAAVVTGVVVAAVATAAEVVVVVAAVAATTVATTAEVAEAAAVDEEGTQPAEAQGDATPVWQTWQAPQDA